MCAARRNRCRRTCAVVAGGACSLLESGVAATQSRRVQVPRQMRVVRVTAPGLVFAQAHGMSTHTLVWLDHQEARIFHIQPERFDETTVSAPARHIHRHPRDASEAKEHPNDVKQFHHDVMHALEGAREILIVGPGTAKLQFLRAAHGQPRLEAAIVGVETVDHPTDKQLVAYARRYFGASDQKP
jgi:hypothetical protein